MGGSSNVYIRARNDIHLPTHDMGEIFGLLVSWGNFFLSNQSVDLQGTSPRSPPRNGTSPPRTGSPPLDRTRWRKFSCQAKREGIHMARVQMVKILVVYGIYIGDYTTKLYGGLFPKP